ncbi:MAG: HlyD family efflux transporter periplasmic adaptor subunit [Bacteroidota bacterium]|nr:HlyD family efflux transporter periplasmic adaptor subunit [Bacteroidota bacterium]
MKARKIVVFVLLLVFLGLLIVVGSISYNSGMSYGEANAEKIRKSKIISVDSVLVENFVTAAYTRNEKSPIMVKSSGRIVPGKMIGISSEVQGVLESSITLKKGTKFKKGDLLFKLRDTDIKLMLAAKKSAYLSLIAQNLPDIATDFSTEFEKWNAFFNAINVDQPLNEFPDFNTTREKNFIISRNILAEYLSIKSDEFRQSKYFQFAPFSGSIVESFTDEGAIVNPGSPVIQIMRNDELEIEIPVPLKFMDNIKVGNTVELKENERSFDGIVIRKGDFINAKTQNVPVYVRPLNTKSLYYGMYVEANIEFNSNQNVVKIPRKALFENERLFTINELDSTLVSISLDIRSSDDKFVYVENLNDSILYVTQPLINKKEKNKVTPVIQQNNE